ncbi:dephospho-CoA kinase [Angustibacter luteus]|uniref:Dephospho-CoA kinase n=1 Tax=Angustibacter luteus TaxID=658456 RepID=A0ABW1JB17_9ACTN
MLRIGLTGGIGAGKSTVAAQLANLGAVVADADRFAREVLAPGTPGLAAVAAEFGPAVLAGDGSLDRAALGRLVFADESRRRALEQITHPLVAQRTAQVLDDAGPEAIVVHDVPLIVEKQMGALYHLVLVVHASERVRIDRLLASRAMSRDDVRARIAAQADDGQRRAAADVWLDNDRPAPEVAADLSVLWEGRLQPFEANLRAGTRADRPARAEIVPYDGSWPAQAARLAARIDLAAGALGCGTQHVGSTAVPGLAAKDVVDLQLGVRSLADADEVVVALAAAGFPRVVGVTRDNPHAVLESAADPAVWSKRFHANADPGRAVNLHVRVVGSPGWRAALLLRDWWRADAVERSAYQGEKQRLAAATDSAAEYADAKEAWFAVAVDRAVAWGRRSGWAPPG